MPQLAGWRPADVAVAGRDLLSRARRIRDCADELVLVGAGLRSCWTGMAADAATAHTDRRATQIDQLADVTHAASLALVRAAEDLTAARSDLQGALRAADTAGCLVSDSGLVTAPTLPALAAGSVGGAADRQADRDGLLEHLEGVASRLTAQVQAALSDAGAADDAAAAALTRQRLPPASPAPVPVAMGSTGSQWGPLPSQPAAIPSTPTPPVATSPAVAGEQATPDAPRSWSGIGHLVLDVAGLVPFIGEPADGINALWYAAEGDTLNAALSGAAMVPGVGSAVTAGKLAGKTVSAASAADDGRRVVHSGAQGKHQLGHPNFLPGRSILTHPDPQRLLTEFSRTGTSLRTELIIGEPGSKERVDFIEIIGDFVSQDGTTTSATTNGIIHYGRLGAHIVPSRP